MKKILLVIVIANTFEANGQSTYDHVPKEVSQVFKYMIDKDFPEMFKDKPFKFRPIRWAIIDIDNDGKTELFLQTFPHFRQSPTISIYQIDKMDSVKRITEGFAPGHLIEISQEQDYLDAHNIGKDIAVDLQIKTNNNPEKFKKYGEGLFEYGLSSILFKNFVHTDKRDGGPIYLDLTYLNGYLTENTCAN